jgi:hypothetical protein
MVNTRRGQTAQSRSAAFRSLALLRNVVGIHFTLYNIIGREIEGYLEKRIHTPMTRGRSTKIVSMTKWIGTSSLSIKNSLSFLHVWASSELHRWEAASEKWTHAKSVGKWGRCATCRGRARAMGGGQSFVLKHNTVQQRLQSPTLLASVHLRRVPRARSNCTRGCHARLFVGVSQSQFLRDLVNVWR